MLLATARVVLLAIALAACSRAPAPSTAPRLASLSPALTETVGALGALDRLIARSDYCALPAQARALPTAGTALTPELERLAALRPDRILIDGSVGARVDELQRLAPVERLPWLTLDEVVASTRRLGELTDREEPAQALARDLESTLSTTPPPDAPAVLAVLGGLNLQDGELWFVKRNSLHGAALHAAGLRNAIDRDVTGPPTLGLEALVALDPPAVIVFDATGDSSKVPAILADWRRMSTLRAVREQRIAVLSGLEHLATGPAIIQTVQELRRIVRELPASEDR